MAYTSMRRIACGFAHKPTIPCDRHLLNLQNRLPLGDRWFGRPRHQLLDDVSHLYRLVQSLKRVQVQLLCH
jgi:hypothetical protein